ncbi:hypothetical protein PTRG_11416 [Pyrenophora tritici-repentis Pt-1C-BFP]|uniref:Uncharacterized protein n=1 Tax=Pyrenophora tritici-repentis (strain Pt-1C-BFP) TaxID=426418 RepID=B2WNF9_PYRTR|nr:uncharacterized protein PTRG_11416 [Pyrenophora tritici-repentis Pt-1C-BFP]EDU44466.1 hypothetical protein PTRG_11416 [Pyrenophora tritici-repentis Pt-1C-BFP]
MKTFAAILLFAATCLAVAVPENGNLVLRDENLAPRNGRLASATNRPEKGSKGYSMGGKA